MRKTALFYTIEQGMEPQGNTRKKSKQEQVMVSYPWMLFNVAVLVPTRKTSMQTLHVANCLN
jgi:hypothetical protein